MLLCNRSDANFSTILCNKRFFNIESFLKLPNFHFLPSFLCTPIDTIHRKTIKKRSLLPKYFQKLPLLVFQIFKCTLFDTMFRIFLCKNHRTKKIFFMFYVFYKYCLPSLTQSSAYFHVKRPSNFFLGKKIRFLFFNILAVYSIGRIFRTILCKNDISWENFFITLNFIELCLNFL